MYQTVKFSLNASLEWLMVMVQTFDMAFIESSYDVYSAVYAVSHAVHEILQ